MQTSGEHVHSTQKGSGMAFLLQGISDNHCATHTDSVTGSPNRLSVHVYLRICLDLVSLYLFLNSKTSTPFLLNLDCNIRPISQTEAGIRVALCFELI